MKIVHTRGVVQFTRSNNAQPLIVKVYFVIIPAAHNLMLFNPLTTDQTMFCDGGQTVDEEEEEEEEEEW